MNLNIGFAKSCHYQGMVIGVSLEWTWVCEVAAEDIQYAAVACFDGILTTVSATGSKSSVMRLSIDVCKAESTACTVSGWSYTIICSKILKKGKFLVLFLLLLSLSMRQFVVEI